MSRVCGGSALDRGAWLRSAMRRVRAYRGLGQETAEEAPWIEPSGITPTGGPASFFSTIFGGVTDIIKTVVAPENVKVAMDRFIFGKPSTVAPGVVSRPGMPVYAPSAIPWGLILAGVAGFYLLTGKKKRR